MNPKENLPQQICDLCIVQLNVSYNFKRLALKNDFQIRQYMIENGISLEKDDQETTIETTTALEIHQIHHNVIRTNRFRQLTAPEIRRNSTTSSVSGNSAMIISARENEATPTSTSNNFVSPRPIVRPIQIKVEPVDPDESPVTSSPSNSSEPSVQTVYSSKPPSEKPSPPMVVINGVFNKESAVSNKESTQCKPKETPKPSTAAPLSVKLGRPRIPVTPRASTTKAKQVVERPRPNLRAVRKKDEARKSKRKLKAVIKKVAKATSKQKQKELKKTPKKTNLKKDKRPEPPKKRGRPRKDPNSPPIKYKKKQPQKSSGRS